MKNNSEVWIVDCYLSALGDEKEYKCQAAVWTHEQASIQILLKEHLASLGYELRWFEESLPVNQYLSRYSGQAKIAPLARAVHPGHVVELGNIVAVSAESDASESYLTITDHAFEPLPDQSGIPFWEQEWIAPELKEILFGQPETGPKLRTYFIVDATLRKNITKVFDLDSLDVPCKCLFKGEAAEELKEAAPYLIDMTLPDGAWGDRDLVPAFHRDFFKKHWGQNTGIFIRSTALMADIWNHFRKFTRIRMEEDGRWVYFRFWDPRIVSAFVEALDEDDTHKFLGLHHLINPAQTTMKAYHATDPIGENARRALPPLIMKNAYLKAFAKSRTASFQQKLTRFIESESDTFERLDANKQSSYLESILKQAFTNGIRAERAVAGFALASVLHGQHLINDPQFERILKSNTHQLDKATELLQQVRYRLSLAA